MDEALKKQASEWFERGKHDIDTAQLLFDEQGYPDIIGYHIQQAIEKYLKGFLVLHEKKPPKIHDLEILLNLASKIDDSLYSFISLCDKATRYYIVDRYPPGLVAEYGIEEIRADLKNTWELIRKITKEVGK